MLTDTYHLKNAVVGMALFSDSTTATRGAQLAAAIFETGIQGMPQNEIHKSNETHSRVALRSPSHAPVPPSGQSLADTAGTERRLKATRLHTRHSSLSRTYILVHVMYDKGLKLP